MPTIHPGVVAPTPGAFKKITFVPKGELFAASDSISFGGRTMATLMLKKKTIKLYDESEWQYGYTATITYSSVEANMTMVKNAYLLTKQFNSLKAEDAATTNIFYFLDGNPRNVGCKYKYEIKKDSRILELTAQCYLTKADWDTLLGNVGASITGETGGSAVGITGGGYSRSKFVPPNWTSFQRTNSAGTAQFGANVDATFTLESYGDIDTDDVDRFTHTKHKFTATGRCTDASLNSIKAFNTDISEDCTDVYTDANGDTYTINHARSHNEVDIADNKREIGWTVTGSTIANPDEATPAFLSFTSTSLEITPWGDN